MPKRSGRPSRRSALCDALLLALEKRSPSELREISDAFADVGLKHLAELCRTLPSIRIAVASRLGQLLLKGLGAGDLRGARGVLPGLSR